MEEPAHLSAEPRYGADLDWDRPLALSTAAQSLTDFEGVLAAKQGSSSDTDVLSLTSAGTTAVAGSHTVVVSQLASTASYYSDSVARESDLLTGSFTVTVRRDGANHFGQPGRRIIERSGGDDQLGRCRGDRQRGEWLVGRGAHHREQHQRRGAGTSASPAR